MIQNNVGGACMVSFQVTHADGDARCGRLSTTHGQIDTPVFMPVGTAGSVKGVTPVQLREIKAQMILANTYHLQLRPTAQVVQELGGLHRFMGWDGPILTDSGGYQVFSLAGINRVTDAGVEFRSHLDGTTLFLDPRIAIDVQNKLGADIIMAFDQCLRLPCDQAALEAAVERTLHWAACCKDAHQRDDQALFGIVQGGLDRTLRQRCAEELIRIGFDGYAIGGLSVGEDQMDREGILHPLVACLPAGRPRYLMGVGTPRDILVAVQAGVDLFDCVLPTRNGRNAWAFTASGILKMRNEQYRRDPNPIEAACDCSTCKFFSRGYIRHLFNAGEMLGPTLTSIHNLRFYLRFMSKIRDLIREGRLARIVQDYPIATAMAPTTD